MRPELSDRPFGKYELVERIASGGMAEVFRGRVRGPEGFVKEVCLKRILPHFSDDLEFVEMFVAEARVAAQLHHANIVQIFDFDSVDGQYYIAMELVDGVDLRRLIQRTRASGVAFPIDVAVYIATEILKGLHYAHTRRWEGRPLGLIHRDVSPHNVLVSHAGEVKLADFGIAKAASRASATRTGVVKGKLPYMAPEQASAGTVDARVDLYATGVVLYEMIAGGRPFVADSDAELLAAILSAPVPPLSDRREDVPQVIDEIVRKLLARNADERFLVAGDALRALATQAPPDGSIRLADHLALSLGSGAGDAIREVTVRLAPGATGPTADTPVVPAESGADTRTRRPAGRGEESEGLAYAQTALGRSGRGGSDGSTAREQTDPSTHVGTITGATPAPVTRTGALPSPALLAPAPRPSRMGLAFVGVGAALSAAAGLAVWLFMAGSTAPLLRSPAVPTTLPSQGPAPLALVAPTTSAPQTGMGPSTAAATAAPRPEIGGFGSVLVTAEPWALVEFDGHSIGQTPRNIDRVAVGRHRVVFAGPGGVRRVRSVTVRRGLQAISRERFEIPTQ